MRVFVCICLATVVAGCSTVPPVAEAPPRARYWCVEVNPNNSATGSPVECKKVRTNDYGETFTDGPPMPSRALDPEPQPERTGFKKFWHNWAAPALIYGALGVMVFESTRKFSPD